MTLITAPQLVTSQETPEGHRDSQQDPPTEAPKMRIPVSPVSLAGGIIVSAATHVASSDGLNAALVTGIFGTTAVVLGQLIPWFLNRRSRRSETALLAMYQAEIERLEKQHEDDQADKKRRHRGRPDPA